MKYRKIVIAMLAVGLVTGFGAYTGNSSAAKELTSESIKEMEGQIEEAEKEKKELQNGLTDLKKIKEELENSKNDLTKYVQELDNNLASIEKKIEELKQLIADKEAEISETEKNLEEAQKVEQEQYEAMKVRIKFMYESGDNFYLDMLFASESFGEILNKADYIEQLSAYDRKMLDEYALNSQMIQLYKEELETEKVILDEAKAGVVAEQAALEDLIGQKEQQIVAYQSDINNKEAAIKEYEADIAEQNAVISALEKAVAEEKARLLAENESVITYDGGMFAWPCPDYKRISDDYGNRMHPTLGIEKFHNGIDLAAPSGSSILAAYDGKVVASAYNGSMGNYVMIDHGNDLYTIYMHASALYVNKGDVVVKGQKIAAVGSTGRSTGPHLHFGVRLNGSYVSPWSYLSK